MQRGYTQGLAAFAVAASKLLVNERWNEVVNIASTKTVKKLFAWELYSVIARSMATKQSSLPL
jgi:hypothetical protein